MSVSRNYIYRTVCGMDSGFWVLRVWTGEPKLRFWIASRTIGTDWIRIYIWILKKEEAKATFQVLAANKSRLKCADVCIKWNTFGWKNKTLLFELYTFDTLHWRIESDAYFKPLFLCEFKKADFWCQSDCSMKDPQLFSEKKPSRAKEKATLFNPSVSQIKSTKWSQK